MASETVTNLVQAMVAGDALETENAFNAAIGEKLSSKLEDMRQGVAQNMFKSSDEEGADEVDAQDDIETAEVAQETEETE